LPLFLNKKITVQIELQKVNIANILVCTRGPQLLSSLRVWGDYDPTLKMAEWS